MSFMNGQSYGLGAWNYIARHIHRSINNAIAISPIHGLTVMISACHSNENERGRPGRLGECFAASFLLLHVYALLELFFYHV